MPDYYGILIRIRNEIDFLRIAMNARGEKEEATGLEKSLAIVNHYIELIDKQFVVKEWLYEKIKCCFDISFIIVFL